MNPHAVVSYVIWLLFVAIWVIVPPSANLDSADFALWNVSMVLVGVAMIAPCLHLLRPDTMIVGAFNGEIFDVYAATGNGNRGILGTGIVFLFPPILTKGYILPLTVVTVPIAASAGVTMELGDQKMTPVLGFLGLQFRLAPNLGGIRRFVRAFPILRSHTRDLTSLDELSFYAGMNDTGKPRSEMRDVSCLARIMQNELQSPIGEAMSRAIGRATLKECLLDRKVVEDDIKKQLPNTVLDQANMLLPETDPVTACEMFDLNLESILPSDGNAMLALSAETTERFNAKGAIAKAEGQKEVRELEGDGEAAFLSKVAAQANTPAGLAALQAQTLRETGANVTIVTAPGALLDAAAAKIVKPTP